MEHEHQCPNCAEKKESKIKHVIAVMSGKGGVGKSSFTALLALALNKQGHKVGILDADITGPSIPKIFGLKEHPFQTKNGILPLETKKGIKIMSMNLLLPVEDEPVIWRGPIISSVIKQFWEEIYWEEIDYLLVDLPPGTSDAPLTVLNLLPVEEVLIVSSPQELADMVVRKSIKMIQKMRTPLLGVVENMSYLKCPSCDEEIKIFGEGKTAETCAELGVDFLGKYPLDLEFRKLSDQGLVEDYEGGNLELLAEKIKDKA